MKNGKSARFRRAWLCAAAVLATGACVDLAVENFNAPDRERALSTPSDIESLVSGSYPWWETTVTHYAPSWLMTTVADAVSSSWANEGMFDNSSEPRVAWNNDPAYEYSAGVEDPWGLSYTALSAANAGLEVMGIDATRKEMVRELGEEDTERLEVFGKLVQGLSLSALSVIFDSAFIVDESTELESLGFSGYSAVWDSARTKLTAAIEMAQGATWQIPSEWVGCNGAWSAGRLAEIARAYRARYAIQVARTPDERENLDWAAIKADAAQGLAGGTHGGYYDTCVWGWQGYKWPLLIHPSWSRMDIRTIGPADASGKWEEWIGADLDDRRSFDIDTDDRRITDETPDSDGMYMRYYGSCPFRPERGLYHCSWYKEARFNYIWEDNQFIGLWPDMTEKELEFIEAEADYRMGNRNAAMATVNKYRTMNGRLPPFRSAGDVAPGGGRCVPQNPDGSCADLWGALKYEKRIEVNGYGMGVEYFDDRGWGDLVQYSWTQLPVPGSELEILLKEIYTFGGRGDDSSAPYLGASHSVKELLGQTTPEALRLKRKLLGARRSLLLEVRPDDVPRNR